MTRILKFAVAGALACVVSGAQAQQYADQRATEHYGALVSTGAIPAGFSVPADLAGVTQPGPAPAAWPP